MKFYGLKTCDSIGIALTANVARPHACAGASHERRRPVGLANPSGWRGTP